MSAPRHMHVRSLAGALALTASMLLGAPIAAQAQSRDVAAAPARAPDSKPAEKNEPALALNARHIPLGGALKAPQLWQAWKARFLTVSGRVIDTGNRGVSHSEGQGYGMLLAVAANDRDAFERIWGWTRANLLVRDDVLAAWRWEPNQRPAVADMNNATDGDILIAWALTEAAELWSDLSHRTNGRRIAVEVGRKLVLFKTKQGALLLPAISGFGAEDRADGPIVNLSYYVFPAFQRLKIVAPEYDWNGLTQTGLDLLKAARFNDSKLPPDWMSVKDDGVKPADNLPSEFSYNAIRLPLYLAWAGIGEREHYQPFVDWARKRAGGGVVVAGAGAGGDPFRDAGYGAVAGLLACVFEGGQTPPGFATLRDGQPYYPATLHLLSVLAAQMRYASCLKN